MHRLVPHVIMLALSAPAVAGETSDGPFCDSVRAVVAARSARFATLGERFVVPGLDCDRDVEATPATFSCALRIENGTSKDDERLIVRVDECLADWAREPRDPKRPMAFSAGRILAKDGKEKIEFIANSEVDMNGAGKVGSYR